MHDPASEEVARRLEKIRQEARQREGFRTPPSPLERERAPRLLAHLVYLLYLIPTPTIVVGAVLAHVLTLTTEQDSWLAAHFRWQVLTFWIGLLGLSLVVALSLMLLGITYVSAAVDFDVRRLLGQKTLFPVTIAMGLLLAWYLYRVGKGWCLLCLGREAA